MMAISTFRTDLVVLFRRLLFAAALAAPAALAGHFEAESGSSEAGLKRTIQAIDQGRLDAALQEVDRLIAERPNFRLAHLLRGDLLLARAMPLKTLGNTGHANLRRIDELRAEALVRVRTFRDPPPPGRFPHHLLQLDPAQRHVIVVDTGRSRLYLYENDAGVPHLVADYYTTLGKNGVAKQVEGDQRTPLGVYFVTSSIPGRKLPDLYGWGAFPINYPNAWDRMMGRTGFGIWLHGVPADTFARAPQASDGCIALSNPDLEQLGKSIQVGVTPVIVSDEVRWVDLRDMEMRRADFRQSLEAWRTDWESRDNERYLSHYSSRFRSGAMDLVAWREHKQRVNSSKHWIKVGIGNPSVFLSPGNPEVMVVTFDQDYRSSNLTQRSRKRQYWVRENTAWKIIFEGPTRGTSIALPESYAGSR